MAHHEWIETGGKRILYLNIASHSIEEVTRKISEFKQVIIAYPPESLLSITDTEGGGYNVEMIKAVKEFTDFSKPYSQKAVVIGLSSAQKLVFDSIKMLSRRQDLVALNSREEAIAFLLSE